MKKMRHILVFIANDLHRFKRKWLSLSLILLAPILFTALLIWILGNVLSVEDEQEINIGLVNMDENETTDMLVNTLADTADFTDGIEMERLDIDEANALIDNNELSAFIVFPENFAENMMEGQTSQLEVTGNPDRKLESYMIRSVVDTLIRHLRNSQSNVLTVNHYAKSFDMSDEQREDLIFQEFVSQFVQVISSDTLVDEEEVSQNFSLGISYFLLNGMFILLTIWLYLLYLMLMKDKNPGLSERMKLLGVGHLAQGISRITALMLIMILPSVLILMTALYLIGNALVIENLMRIGILIVIHLLITVILLLIVDWLSKSYKLTMILQLMMLSLIIVFSGAIIPRIYFPLYFDWIFDVTYSYQALNWLQEIVLNERFTMEINIMLFSLCTLLVMMLIIGLLKERRVS
ncbi:ABC transporter permease [Jeotgalicoccus sp. S0W5]|uniref:ABC transporter permease n=1 Tax=Jeotgalicoccus sp. S0W5 TaxID=2527874 RepID=UPI001415240C|nr:ABC transporter permease [Jeotgalicoccus sp. S0W5]